MKILEQAEWRMVEPVKALLAWGFEGLLGLTSVKRSWWELVGVKKMNAGMDFGRFGGVFGSEIEENCGKEKNLRLTMVCGVATVEANVNQCSTSSTGSRRRSSSRRQRGLLSNVRTISTKTHGWQRSWVFLCDLRPPVKPQETAENCKIV